jgi:hypothetical protein
MSASPDISETRSLDARHSTYQVGWKKCVYCGLAEYIDEIDEEFARRLCPEIDHTDAKTEVICKKCLRMVLQYGCGIAEACLNRKPLLMLRISVMNWLLKILFGIATPTVEHSTSDPREDAR